MRAAIALLGLALGLASAQQRQEILDYKLTMARADQLLAALPAMTKYVLSLPDWQERIAKTAKMPPAERLAQIEKDPKAMAILKQNNLTVKDYVFGVPALRMAIMVAQGVNSSNIYASPENVAFAKANLAQLKPKMDAADGATKR